ncbi:MAG: hypothetical protein ACO1Q7_17065 [Gemmatimonas sp.]
MSAIPISLKNRECSRRYRNTMPFVARVGVGLGFAALLTACAPKADAPAAESAAISPPTTLPEPAPVANAVTEFGYGAIRAGMTYAEANAAVNGALKASPNENLAECGYVKWEGGPAGLLVMVLENKIARVDATEAGLTSDKGAKIGDTEDHVKSLYGDRVTVSPHKYVEGNYLTVRAADTSDTTHAIVFETEKGVVTRFRGGAKPGVQFVEGCS